MTAVRPGSQHILRAAVIAIAVTAVYLLRLDQAAGLYVDDAWYLVLAQALSRGEGFRLISSAAAPILPAFPPGFPMILAPVISMLPDFPSNVTALKLVSFLAMGGVGLASYRYVERWYGAPRPVAAAVAVITMLMPAFVFLATSTVMAEATFTLAQLCFALAVERAACRHDTTGIGDAVACGVIAGATLLVRLAGVAAIVAGMLYLLRVRGWRTAVVFAAVAAACYAPWAIYAAMNRAPLPQRVEHGGSIAYGYDELLLMRQGGEPGGGQVTLAELPGRVAFNIANIFGRDAGAFVFPAAYRGFEESGLEAFQLSGETGFRATGMGGGTAVLWVSWPISTVMLIGFAAVARRRATVAEYMIPMTVAMVVLVPARTFRYVLPLTPFLLFYFFRGVETIAAVVRRIPEWSYGAPSRITAACILALIGFEHVQYIRAARSGPRPVWLRDYDEVRNVIDWLTTNLPDGSPIASSNPGLVYLATGRKTVALSNPRTHLGEWQALGVRYAVALHVADRPPRSLGFRPLYASPRLKLWVVEVPADFDRK
jgi:hypothetical protein